MNPKNLVRGRGPKTILGALMEAHGLTQTQLTAAARYQVGYRLLERQKTGYRYNYAVMEKLASCFHVKADDLFDVERRPRVFEGTLPKGHRFIPATFHKTVLQAELERRGLGYKSSSQKCGVDENVIRLVCTVRQRVRPRSAERISKGLGIPVSDLFHDDLTPRIFEPPVPKVAGIAEVKAETPASAVATEKPEWLRVIERVLVDATDAVLLAAGEIERVRVSLEKPLPARVETTAKLDVIPAPAKAGPTPPRWAVVGLIPEQARDVESEYGGFVECVDKDRSDNGRLTTSLKSYERVYLMTRFVPHAWQTSAIEAVGRSKIRRVLGGVSDLKRALTNDLAEARR